MPELSRYRSRGVILHTDRSCPASVRFGFTERSGGVSFGVYSSLNLGLFTDDNPDCVQENRRRVLSSLGAADWADELIAPVQQHGDTLVHIYENSYRSVRAAQACAGAGADGVICTAFHVPVLLAFADCVPVVLLAPGKQGAPGASGSSETPETPGEPGKQGGFAVVHSGWRGSLKGISGKAARELARACGCSTRELRAYIGPYIKGRDYEVSQELLDAFYRRFGASVCAGGPKERLLDVGEAVRLCLEEAGVDPHLIIVSKESTASATDRFFSYRAEKGHTGRQGAAAVLCAEPWELEPAFASAESEAV